MDILDIIRITLVTLIPFGIYFVLIRTGVFKSETLKRILIYHHTIINVSAFNMTEIKE